MLGEIFNDPSATSLTKLNLEDSDSDNDDLSGSGSDLWSSSGDSTKPSEESSLQGATETTNKSPLPQQTESSTQTGITNPDKATSDNTVDAKDSNETMSRLREADSSNTASNKDSDNKNNDTDATPDSINSDIASTAEQNVPLQSSTDPSSNSSTVTTQSADTTLPSAEDQSQNSVIQNEESIQPSNDTSATKADFFPSQSQNYLETFPGNPEADFVGQQEQAFDDNVLYDPTIVKKTSLPVVSDSLSNPFGTFKIANPVIRNGLLIFMFPPLEL